MAGPAKGFNLYRPWVQPQSGTITIEDNIRNMAIMGADTAKVPVYWGGNNYFLAPSASPGFLPPCQTSVSGAWNMAQIQQIKDLVDEARTTKSDFSVIVSFISSPSDVSGGLNPEGHPLTAAGWEQHANAAVFVMAELGDRCKGIELGNEPNLISGDGSTHVSTEIYSGMATHLLYAVYNCFGHTNGNLNRHVLIGALAAGNPEVENRTEGLSPIAYAKAIAILTYTKLIQLLGSANSPLLGLLANAWKLSIHCYPNLGKERTVEGVTYCPTHPDNPTGDKTGLKASNTVWAHYEAFQSEFAYRNIWITETGVSSNKLGESGQADFYSRLTQHVRDRYQANDQRLEGLLNWGFCDCDPSVYDPQGQFFRFGVIKDTDGETPKYAAHFLQTLYLGAWA